MKKRTKEAIRNQITGYAGMAWDAKRVEEMHPLLRLMVEGLSNELYLMECKLHGIDTAILDKLVENMLPPDFNYVRTGTAIAQVRPARHKLHLGRMTEFFVKEMPSYLLRRNLETVAFTPVTDIQLNNLGISHLFHDRELWETDGLGNRKLVAKVNQRHGGNKIWMLINNPGGIKRVKDLYFYIDFPHLDDNHVYYQTLSLLEWKAGDKVLFMDQGLPLTVTTPPSKVESEVLSYHRIHYLSVKGELHLDDKACQQIPGDLALLLGPELAGALPVGSWISIAFPAHFKADDLGKMRILLNAFPVLNRRHARKRQDAGAFMDVIALSSEPGEEFLELEHVGDTNKNSYVPGTTVDKPGQGTYSLEAVKKKEIHDTRFHDSLELFADVLERERAVFPKIDKDKVMGIQNAVAALQEDDGAKTSSNILDAHSGVARLSVNLKEEARALLVEYWTTLGETLNGLPANTGLMAGQTTALSKSETVLVTAVTGGHTFYDPYSLRAVNRFYLTSKGRILTKHDMLAFCRIEVGKYAKSIDAVRCGKISPKPGEGIVNAIEIRVTPKENCQDYFKQKEVVRWLKLRLEERSPIHYNYVITIIE